MPRIFVAFLLSFIVFLIFLISSSPVAALSCEVEISPLEVASGSSSNLNFSITNGGPESFILIHIQSPDLEYFRIDGGSASGWSASVQNQGELIAFSGGTLATSQTQTFSVSVFALQESEGLSFAVGPSADGSSFGTCGGQMSVSAVPGSSIFSVSSLAVSASSTSATISWTTSEVASSNVSYGTTSAYGSTAGSDDLVTSHSVSITGLSASTTYYYQACSTNEGEQQVCSGQNTFTTSAAGSSTTTTTTGTTTTTATPTPAPKDKTGPAVLLTTSFEKPFEQAPTIEGKAVDLSKIIKIEYSTDGGDNWLPADSTDLGEKTAQFEFTPELFEDGNYEIIVRAFDVEDNEGKSKVSTLVIDRLPPLVGGGLFAIGPQILFPDSGSIVTLAGIDTSVVFASSGGATSIKIVSDDYDFGLSKNSENGLWYGNLNFKDPGTYDLTARSIDGAENETERAVGRVVVLAPGKVLPEDGGSIPQSKVLVYVKDPILGTFSLWDSSAWGQENPQNLKEGGNYRLVLPPGTYYLQVQAHGYKALKTNIFSLEKTTPIVSTLTLSKKKTIKIGPFEIPLFDFGQTSGQINTDYEIPKVRDLLVGKELPNFQIEGLERKIDSTSFKGRPTLLSILSTWHPQSSSQIKILGELGEELEANVIVIMTQDSPSKVRVSAKRGWYELQMASDRDGELISALGLSSLPANYFVDRRGVVTQVKSGIITKGEIQDSLLD